MGSYTSSALSSAIPEADSRKIRLLAPHTILIEGHPPSDFQTIVANGQLEAPIATVDLQFEVGDIIFRENFIVKKNLTRLLTGHFILQYNNKKPDICQVTPKFHFFSMQRKMKTGHIQIKLNPY